MAPSFRGRGSLYSWVGPALIWASGPLYSGLRGPFYSLLFRGRGLLYSWVGARFYLGLGPALICARGTLYCGLGAAHFTLVQGPALSWASGPFIQGQGSLYSGVGARFNLG